MVEFRHTDVSQEEALTELPSCTLLSNGDLRSKTQFSEGPMPSQRDSHSALTLVTEQRWTARDVEQVDLVGVLASDGAAFVWHGWRDSLSKPFGTIWEVSRRGLTKLTSDAVPRVCAVAELHGGDVGLMSATPLERAFPSDARLEFRTLDQNHPMHTVAPTQGRAICRVDWHGGDRSAWSSSIASMVWGHGLNTVQELAPANIPLSFHNPAIALSRNGQHVAVSRKYPFVELYEISGNAPRAYSIDTDAGSLLVPARDLTPEQQRHLDANGFRADALSAVAVRKPATKGHAGSLWVQSMDVSNDGRIVILVSHERFSGDTGGDRVLCIDGESTAELEVGESIVASAVHAETRKVALVSAAEPNRVTVHRFRDGHVTKQSLESERPTSLRWSVDGGVLAVASVTGAQIWKTAVAPIDGQDRP